MNTGLKFGLAFLLAVPLLYILVGSVDNTPDGTTKVYHEFKCVKSEMNTGLSVSGKLVVVSSCMIAKCFRIEEEVRKYTNKRLDQKIVDDNYCLKGEY